MPNFNCGRFIRESIHSVLDQTLVDFELIVIDDGSTDSSLSVVEEVAIKDSRIQVLKNTTNEGVSHSINRGISVAAGQFVCLVGSDDILRPTRLERMVKSLEQSENCIAYTDIFLIDESGYVIKDSFADTNKLPPAGNAFPFLLTRAMMGIGVFMARTSAVRRAGFYDETLHWGEDLDYALRLTERNEVTFVPEALYGYRMHRHSKTATYLPKAKDRDYARALDRSLRRNCGNLDDNTRLKAIQRVRKLSRRARMGPKFIYWSLNPHFVGMMLKRPRPLSLYQANFVLLAKHVYE